ncbi:MAG TPA: tetratricopeptide repeat protein, partial [Flavitalea sp.]|nr:tetratricopeptide repeat protein [Flavitalea sp.]
NRPNTDNWRRSGAISRNTGVREEREITSAKDLPGGADSVGDISYESLMKNIPLTEDMLKKSKDSMERATFILGKIYFESLEDYPETMTTLESLLEKYPATVHKPEALFMLNYCYNKTGNITRASETKQMLEQQYAGSEYQRMVTNPGSGTIKSITEADMNRRYESIYNSFIEGRFGQALDDKKIADSLYGVNYWTPQLLYIESVYHIKQKQDDQAKLVLQNIIKLYPTSPLSPRAQTMLDVLGRRKEIEEYLTNLKIVRPGEDSAYILNDDSPVKKVIVNVEAPVVPVDSAALRQADSAMALQKLEDSLQAKSGVKPVTAKTKDSVNTGLVKVTPKQMADTFSRSIPGVTTGDTLSAADLQKRADSIELASGRKQPDTAAKVSKPKRVINSVYTADNDAPHMVMMILDKVDPVYVGEAKNAFNRYNKQNYFNTPIETVNQPLSDSVSLVVISPFANAAAALDYTRKTAEIAGTSIIPWMPKGKFTFVVITPANLALLQTRKDLAEYLKFHGQAY